MATTPHLGLTLVEQAQAQKEVTVNMALMRIDALLNSSVIDKDLAAPPASPEEGDVYIVANDAIDGWAGKDRQIAYFEQIWRFITPNEGLMLWVQDEGAFYVYDGSNWVISASGGGEGGEANTGVNANGDTGGVFKNKSSTSLVFNNIVAGSNVSISGGGVSGGDIIISAATGGGGTITLADVTDAGSLAGQSSVDNGDWSGDALAVYNGGTGKTSVASDCLLRGNGASALLESGVKIDGNDNIHGFRSAIVPVAGTSYTLAAADTGKIVETVNSGEVTLIIPDSLPQGFTVTVAQMGAGQVVFSATGGATLLNRHGHDRTAGQYALCTLYISSNSDGSSAISVMAGDAA